MKKINIVLILVFIVTVVAVFVRGYGVYQNIKEADTQDRYVNGEYGFEVNLPDLWRGYSVLDNSWTGWKIDGSAGSVGDYGGPLIVLRNPKWTVQQLWQDIPIMVISPKIWNLIQEEKVSVSAAPIPPEKIGENSRYVFATPPRWYGFTDDLGWQEAVNIVKTFKAFEIK